jgi:hypothetical protein
MSTIPTHNGKTAKEILVDYDVKLMELNRMIEKIPANLRLDLRKLWSNLVSTHMVALAKELPEINRTKKITRRFSERLVILDAGIADFETHLAMATLMS